MNQSSVISYGGRQHHVVGGDRATKQAGGRGHRISGRTACLIATHGHQPGHNLKMAFNAGTRVAVDGSSSSLSAVLGDVVKPLVR
jgi:hypothetical protein